MRATGSVRVVGTERSVLVLQVTIEAYMVMFSVAPRPVVCVPSYGNMEIIIE